MVKFFMVVYSIYMVVYILLSKLNKYTKVNSNSEYESTCRRWQFFAWLPCITSITIFIVLFIKLGLLDENDFTITSFFMAMYGTFTSCFNSFFASKMLVTLAIQSSIDSDRVKKERNNMLYGGATLGGGIISTFRHTKKNVKNVLDVDHWQEMK